jgi:hypothetical protein
LEGQTCLLSGGAPDSPVHHWTITVAIRCAISFLFWRIRPLVLGVSWRTGHFLVHTGQSGVPNQPLLRATRRPRIARLTVALVTVGSPDSPVIFRRTPPSIPESSTFHWRPAWRTGHCLAHHRTLSGAPPDSSVHLTRAVV